MINHSKVSHISVTILLFFISLTTCQVKKYFTDPQGNTYQTVFIGNQEWMSENLKYNPGDSFYWYDNDTIQCSEMGGLYTWSAAVKASKQIEGWHLPSKQEWLKLIHYFGGDGSELDSSAYSNMISASSGFHPQWSGVRISTGIFKGGKMRGVNYWSSTSSESDTALAFSVGIISKFKIVSPHHYPKQNACSVRLIKDG
jgi:uncharacterized protein (TIGR02145 family)